jgi:hypothetical protein
MSDYPEHIKLESVKVESQAQGELLDWLSSQGIHLMVWSEKDHTWYAEGRNIQQLLAAFHEIDLNTIETEKRAMLAQLREVS